MADAKTVQTHEFKVNMTCKNCSEAVKKVLDAIKDEGVEEYKVSLEEQKVEVKTSLPAEKVLEVIKTSGKDVELITNAEIAN